MDYLAPRGYATDFVDELFDSVTTRVLCLVQRELDSHEFQFEVQPLREYFAAEHLYDVSPNNTAKNNRQACLAQLVRRPDWNNVMRFFAVNFLLAKSRRFLTRCVTCNQTRRFVAIPSLARRPSTYLMTEC